MANLMLNVGIRDKGKSDFVALGDGTKSVEFEEEPVVGTLMPLAFPSHAGKLYRVIDWGRYDDATSRAQNADGYVNLERE